MNQLKKVIRWYELLAIGVGGILGTSWVYLNTKFYNEYGTGGVIFGFLLATLMAVFVSLSYAELGSALKRDGGEIVFAYAAFGLRGAFIAGWTLFTAYTTCVCFYVPAAGYLFEWFFPELNTIKLWTIADTPVYLPSLSLGVFFLILFFILNYKGVKLATLPQFFMTFLLVGFGLVLFFVATIKGSLHNITPLFLKNRSPLKCTIRFSLLAMTYLTGFSALTMLGEESAVEEKTFGNMIVMSVFTAGLFYILMMIGGAILFSWQKILNLEKGMIDEFYMLYKPLGRIAWFISFLGMLTSLNGLMLAASRTIFVMGRAGVMPIAFAAVDEKHRTPKNALIFVFIIALVLGLLGKKAMIWFLDIGGISIGIAWALCVLSMLKLRKKCPHLKRPFKAPFMFIIAPFSLMIVISIFAVSLIPGTPLSLNWPYEYSMLLIWIILGGILHILSQKRWKVLTAERIAKNLLGKYLKDLY